MSSKEGFFVYPLEGSLTIFERIEDDKDCTDLTGDRIDTSSF